MRIGGLSSGIEWPELIRETMALEGQPIQRAKDYQATAQKRMETWEALKADLQSLRNAVIDLRFASAFSIFQVTSSDQSALAATAVGGAQTGTYHVEVTQLATAFTVRSRQAVTVNDAGVPVFMDDQEERFLSGTFSLGFNENNLTAIEITDADTLADIRDKINALLLGITARIIDGHVVLSGQMGSGNIVFEDNDGILADLGLVQDDAWNAGTVASAANAELTINGIAITRSTNSIADAIPGVTLNLAAVTSGPVSISVARDADAIVDKLNTFVARYNETVDKMRRFADYKEDGPLQGDFTLTRLSSALQRFTILSAADEGAGLRYLSQLGIKSAGRSGLLEIDEAMLRDQLATNFDGVVRLFTTTETGLSDRMYRELTNMIGADGMVSNRVGYFKSSIADYDRQIKSLESRLAIREERLVAEFNAMEKMIAQYQSQGDFMNQILLQMMPKQK